MTDTNPPTDHRTTDGRANIGPGGSLDLDHVFTYHAPHGDQIERYAELREHGRRFAMLLAELVPGSVERSTALSRLREVVMWANAGIACNEPEPAERPRRRFTEAGEVDACDAYDSQFITMPDGGLVDPRLLALLRDAGDEWGPTGVVNIAQQLLRHERGSATPAESTVAHCPLCTEWLDGGSLHISATALRMHLHDEHGHSSPVTLQPDGTVVLAVPLRGQSVFPPKRGDHPGTGTTDWQPSDPYAAVETDEPITVTTSPSVAQSVCMITHEPPWCDGPCQHATPREATPDELAPPGPPPIKLAVPTEDQVAAARRACEDSDDPVAAHRALDAYLAAVVANRAAFGGITLMPES